MATPNLTNGAITAIINGQTPHKPILQVLNLKKIQSETAAQDRYRLQMSDGTNYQPCMLATQMNHLVQSERMDKYCVVEVERYICNTIHERKIIIVIQLNVLKGGADVGGPIGKPQPLELVRVDANSGSPANGPPAGRALVPPDGGNQPRGGGGGGNFNGQANVNQRSTPHQQTGGYRQGGSGGSTATGGVPGNRGYGSSSGGGNVPGSRGYGSSGGGGGSVPGSRGYGSSGGGGVPGNRGYGGGGGGMMTPMAGLTSPGGTPLSQRNTVPINSLNPYQNKWTIRARVSSKPALRKWSNSRGEGKVLNVDLVDEEGEIRACGFNEVADKFHSLFEMGKVYYISRGRLKPTNRAFNNLKNDYELNLSEDTEVEACLDAVPEVPTLQYNFKAIADLEKEEPNTLVDVIGVCKYAADLASIITKTTNRKISKREVHLVDRSSRTISCTLWGSEAEEFDGSKAPIVAVKGAKVSDFGGRSLSTQFSSVLMVNPDIPEAHSLRGWYDSTGQHEDAASLSDQRGGGTVGGNAPHLSFGQVKELDLGRSDKPDYFNCKGSVMFARNQNVLYKACPNQDCNKKVTEGAAAGQYFCEKCNQSFPDFKYRMILSINVGDHSGSQWLTCFQDTGTEILGKNGQELGELKEQDEGAYDQVFQQANFKEYMFRIRAKMDTFNDEQRLKCYCVSVSPVNYAQETIRRVEEIKQIMAN